jgi:hypothetical protein
MSRALAYLAGFASGWAVRSGVDSSADLAVRALEIAYVTKARVVRWVAAERERIADLVAEAETNAQATLRRDREANELLRPSGPHPATTEDQETREHLH